MRQALRLAEKGYGFVSPNPMVGAVIVRDGEIVGRGAHLKLGGAHAETCALEQAGKRARKATMYVTLEPCSHTGNTPPCSFALVEAGISRVVCAMEDPDVRVHGGGIGQLRKAGVEVEVGLLRERAETQNAAYIKHRNTGLPLVILKLAQTMDGRIAASHLESGWITGTLSRTHAHRWRSRVDGILVGAGTVLADDPSLTVRHVKGRNPQRLIVDGKLRVQPSARVFQERSVLITASDHTEQALAGFANERVDIWRYAAEDGRIDLRSPLAEAGRRGLTSILIEGGAELATHALREQLVDRIMIYVAPKLLGHGVAGIGDLGIVRADESLQLSDLETRRLGGDTLFTAKVDYGCLPA